MAGDNWLSETTMTMAGHWEADLEDFQTNSPLPKLELDTQLIPFLNLYTKINQTLKVTSPPSSPLCSSYKPPGTPPPKTAIFPGQPALLRVTYQCKDTTSFGLQVLYKILGM